MTARRQVAIIGAGPAGLIAAETLARSGIEVVVYDRMPSPARKFLMAGRGGLNLTHSEPFENFIARYGEDAAWLKPAIESFPPAALRQWCEDLGEPTFIGSSGRIFPKSFKASPLLRAWLRRLEALGVTLKPGHIWQGWTERGALRFRMMDGGVAHHKADAVLLALGGASWPRLGSDGQWTTLLEPAGVSIAPLQAANCGFCVSWSDEYRNAFAGRPIKTVTVSFKNQTISGELMPTDKGVEGGAIYALSRRIRNALSEKAAIITIDLRPALTLDVLEARLTGSRKRQSFSTWLRKDAGLSDTALGLFKECTTRNILDAQPSVIARTVKALPLAVTAPFPLERAISTAGGVRREALDESFMVKAMPGVFAAGEMLDWEAPTGGYLLQACFSTGIAAANGIIDYLNNEKPEG